MKSIKYIFYFSIFLFLSSCITQFIPETNENQEILVVEGLITNQHEVNSIKLSRTLPLGKKIGTNPLRGCRVVISDDSGNSYTLIEKSAGNYVTDTSTFQGVIGRKYKLNIYTNGILPDNYSYESLPMEMKATPAIDSLYYEKVIIKEKDPHHPAQEGAQIYLNTHDQTKNCKYFRWDYNETWEFHLPFAVPVNNICWLSNNARSINIKNTSILTEDVIDRFPLNFISNETDRLKVKYSILVNQYSMNEDEYDYWEKLQNITQDVGSLYDIIPASIPSNIYCIENPGIKVLGYFSVSAKTSRRLFIKPYFSGLVNLYSDCISDTIYNNATIPNLNISAWIIELSNPFTVPPYAVITNLKGCADCTVRGTKTEPYFWNDDK